MDLYDVTFWVNCNLSNPVSTMKKLLVPMLSLVLAKLETYLMQNVKLDKKGTRLQSVRK